MERVQQVLVQTLVKEEQSIVPREHLLVVLYQTDTIQQVVIVQIISVQVKRSVQLEHIVLVDQLQTVQEEQNIVQQEQHHVALYQVDITQQVAIVQIISVQVKRSVQLEHIVLVELLQTVKEEQNIVQQEQHYVVLYQVDITQQVVTHLEINVQDKASVEKEITVQTEFQQDVEQENIMI